MKVKWIKLSVFFVFLCLYLLLNACATLGPIYQKVDKIQEGKALVYIYRPPSVIGGGVSYEVRAGRIVIATLHSGGYYPYMAEPGETEFWAKTESKSAVTLDIKTGQTYYIKGTVGIGFFIGRPHLIVVSSDVGEREIAECKLIPEEYEDKKTAFPSSGENAVVSAAGKINHDIPQTMKMKEAAESQTSSVKLISAGVKINHDMPPAMNLKEARDALQLSLSRRDPYRNIESVTLENDEVLARVLTGQRLEIEPINPDFISWEVVKSGEHYVVPIAHAESGRGLTYNRWTTLRWKSEADAKLFLTAFSALRQFKAKGAKETEK